MFPQAQFTDKDYLRGEQYKNAGNLSARAYIHTHYSTNKYGWMKWMFEQIDLPAEARLLELGCGPGWLWADNAARIPAGWNITLSDFSAGMVEEAERNLAKADHKFTFKVIDIQHIPFEDETFDGVIANHMLYHVPDRALAIREVHRILKPGGTFFAATNGHNHLNELHDLVDRFLETPMDYKLSRAFELENGAAQLGQVFPQVKMRRYEDSLVVTDVEPLVQYILSTTNKAEFSDRSDHLRVMLTQEIAQHGAIRIRKDAGVFIAAK